MNILSFPYIDTATPVDLEEGKRLQAEFERLDAHIISVRHATLIEKWLVARDEYLASPTDKNFERVKLVSFERRFFRVQHEAKNLAHGARGHFIETQIVPWATALLNRALDKARANLARVTEEEAARHLKLTGEPMSVSGIVEAALRPVRHLENLLNDAPGNPRALRVASILKLFEASGPLLGNVSPVAVALSHRPPSQFKKQFAIDGSGLKRIADEPADPAFAEGLDGDAEKDEAGEVEEGVFEEAGAASLSHAED